MPHFTLQTSPNGPVIDMHVSVSQARLHALQAAQEQIPALQPIRALVDTGASCTCIDPSVLAQLGLQPTGATCISTPSTDEVPFNADTYDVGILIPVAKQHALILPKCSDRCHEASWAAGLSCAVGPGYLAALHPDI